ncbi:MAG TPA: hypothetical protein VGK04_09765 [Thermoanaerobaculia bacterium]
MKELHGVRRLAAAVKTVAVIVLLLSARTAQPKGNGVSLWMEGRVSNVEADGDRIHFLLTGSFRLEQYRGKARSVVEVDGRRGMRVTIRQADPFFAMTSDWKGGAIRENGALLHILDAAATRKRIVKFELSEAQLVFSAGGVLTVSDGAVRRAIDANLR